MDLKPQDLLVLLKAAAHPPQRWTYAALGEAPVWVHPDGSARGPSLSLLYRTALVAALADPALHRLLALLDALRVGRVRERRLAADLLESS